MKMKFTSPHATRYQQVFRFANKHTHTYDEQTERADDNNKRRQMRERKVGGKGGGLRGGCGYLWLITVVGWLVVYNSAVVEHLKVWLIVATEF